MWMLQSPRLFHTVQRVGQKLVQLQWNHLKFHTNKLCFRPGAAQLPSLFFIKEHFKLAKIWLNTRICVSFIKSCIIPLLLHLSGLLHKGKILIRLPGERGEVIAFVLLEEVLLANRHPPLKQCKNYCNYYKLRITTGKRLQLPERFFSSCFQLLHRQAYCD